MIYLVPHFLAAACAVLAGMSWDDRRWLSRSALAACVVLEGAAIYVVWSWL